MSKVKSYGLKAYVSNAFDLCVGKESNTQNEVRTE